MNWQKLRKNFNLCFWQKKVIVTLTSLLEGLCRLCLASKLQEAFWRLKPRDTCERKRYFILIKPSCLKKCPGDQTFSQSNSPYFKMIFIIAKHVQKWPHFASFWKGYKSPTQTYLEITIKRRFYLDIWPGSPGIGALDPNFDGNIFGKKNFQSTSLEWRENLLTPQATLQQVKVNVIGSFITKRSFIG